MTSCKAAKMSELKDVPQWVKKIKTIFLLLDVNNTGYISKDDWVRVADRLGEKNGLAQSDPKVAALRIARSQFYDELSLGKLRLKEKEFVQLTSDYATQQTALRRKQQPTATQTMIDAYFQALDKDDNGYLSPREWEVYFNIWNLPDFKTKSAEAFKVADKNNDGRISLEEYRKYNIEFWQTDEDTFGVQGMYGPSFQQ